MNDYERLKREVEELKAWKRSLESSNSIPLPIDQSFRARFATNSLKKSGKTQASEAVTVNEAGAAAPYLVQQLADEYLQVSVSGLTKYIPVYTTL